MDNASQRASQVTSFVTGLGKGPWSSVREAGGSCSQQSLCLPFTHLHPRFPQKWYSGAEEMPFQIFTIIKSSQVFLLYFSYFLSRSAWA